VEEAMEKLEAYAKKAKSLGVSKAKIIESKTIVVGNWVRLKCQFGCGGYGECLTCPPYSPTPEFTEKLLGDYSQGLLMQIENISSRDEGRIFKKFRKIVADLEREIFLDGYYKALGMTAGPCSFCPICDTSKSCKHPRLARPSMEACGIDVYKTARNNGLSLQVVKSREFPCSYISLILIE
jgi:predicted metal-binding protein